MMITEIQRALMARGYDLGGGRIKGHVVRALEDHPRCYRVDGGAPLTSGQIVALAWDAGLMSGPAEMQ